MSDFYEEACYLSNSEAEPDSETEDAVVKPAAKAELAWDDPQALLNTWLGELDNLNMFVLVYRVLFFVGECGRRGRKV
ncbi:hypothetical protein OUZ56_027941 [Daphnia magna]|uniref:Uncharacterized protein n=1 Tax=Daphnia magna TaxID=35525 RepID=A0ABR0B2D2_9CRUS|nr:hypothetical protein OUZ56_027941 [Daphnia magna]